MRKPYDIEQIKQVIVDSVSVREVLRKLGKKITGGNHSHLTAKIKKYNIDISHFTGKASNCGEKHRGGPEKLTPEQVLVHDRYNGVRTRARVLRAAMVAVGFPYRCMKANCAVSDMWNGEKLNLQVDHISGDPLDNRRENLRFLCPNCHVQTPTHSTRKNV